MTDHPTLRADFNAEMVEVVRREIPEALDWLDLADLPPLRWREDGSVVDAIVQRGWLVTAFTCDKPRATTVLHHQTHLFERESTAAFGRWLLQAWIAHDTETPTISDARRIELRATAEQAAQLASRFGRDGTDPEERFGQLLQQEENRAAPSALPYRGLLSVVEACADDTITEVITSYLAQHSRERPDQSRLLVETLRAVDASSVPSPLNGEGT